MANMEDVARLAEVSTATVSHVINNTRFVKQDTKEKVLKAMDELNYHPNFAARSLRSQKSHIIGLLIPDISNIFYLSLVSGVESIIRENGYNLIVSNSDGDVENEKEQLRIFSAQLIDGLIMRPVIGNHSFLEDILKDYPVVFVDCKPNNYDKGDFVSGDNEDGAFQAVKLLLEKGHQRIGIITGIPGLTTSDERLKGYKRAFREYGQEIDKSLIKIGDYRIKSGYRLTRDFFAEGSKISALLITNNAMTIGSMKYLKENGVKIPEELAIIGFDDSEWASITEPPLTVVKYASYEMGRRAATLLIERINNKEKNNYQEYRLPVEIIERRSC